jgi:hypothetical protein
LALSNIMDWFHRNKTATSDYGELIKEKLADGNYRIIGGIFDKRGYQIASQTWETEKLDSDLQQRFGNKDRIHVELN